MAWRRLLACWLLLQPAGCSLYWTQSVDPFVPPNPPLCDADLLAPSLDTIMTVALAAAAVGYVSVDPRSAVRRQSAIVDGSLAALFAASGTLGFWRLNQCMTAQSHYRQWLHDAGLLTAEGALRQPPGGAFFNPPARNLEDEEDAEQQWQDEQARRFASEQVQHSAEMEAYRRAHPMILATLRLTNATGGDSAFAVRVRMEDTEEDFQSLEAQPVAAQASALFANALQVREGVAAELMLVISTGPTETVLPLDAALHAGGILHATFDWDAKAGRFVLQQVWE